MCDKTHSSNLSQRDNKGKRERVEILESVENMKGSRYQSLSQKEGRKEKRESHSERRERDV